MFFIVLQKRVNSLIAFPLSGSGLAELFRPVFSFTALFLSAFFLFLIGSSTAFAESSESAAAVSDSNNTFLGVLIALLLVLPVIIFLWQKLKQERGRSHLFRTILDGLPDIVFYKDNQGIFQYVNDRGRNTLGQDPIGKSDHELFDDAVARRHQTIDRRTMATKSDHRCEEWLTGSDGREFLVQTSKSVLVKNTEAMGIVGISRDVTELRKTQDNLEFIAHHDALTGLANRTLLLKEFDFALRLCARRSESLAVIYLDLDHFKDVNDSLGHDIGDLLLKNVASRLSRSLRGSDLCARLGGDEFVMVLPASGALDELQKKVGLMLETIAETYEIRDHSLKVFASAGVALFPDDGQTAETLIRHADTALRVAKDSGRGVFQFYDASMSASLISRLSLEQDLRTALSKGELHMAYQPQLQIGSSIPTRVEALMRWHHPVRGVVSPMEFIAVAETTGQIIEMGFWALKTACMDFLRWREQGVMLEKIAINVSAIQINHHFADRVLAILASLQFRPAWLELEITETTMMHGLTEVTQQMDRLRARGVEFSIDDFGTGYSSLSKIKSMPVSLLKIDKSFIQDILIDKNDYEIARAVILMAKSLGLTVVAEGVETTEQETILADMGCDWVQGYLYGPPLTSKDFVSFFHTSTADDDQQNVLPAS